jgi:hypothetical protein
MINLLCPRWFDLTWKGEEHLGCLTRKRFLFEYARDDIFNLYHRLANLGSYWWLERLWGVPE